MKKQLLTSSIFRFLERGIVVITSFLLTPFFINELGSTHYGLWLLVLSILGWFNVVDLGFPQAIQRQIVQALELNDKKRVNVIFSTGLVLFTVLGGFSVLTLVGLTTVPAIFGVEGLDQITLVDILLILSVKVLWGFMMNPFHGFFSGMLRFDIDANISSLNAVVKAAMVFLLLSDLNIWGAVVATLASDILTNTLKIYYAKRLFPDLSFSFKLASKKELIDLFAYSKHLVINGVANTIGTKSRPLIITQLFDLPSLALASIASNLIMHTSAFVSSITGVFSPLFNKKAARKENMEKLFNQTTSINLFSSTVLFLSLFIFGKVFILLWVGNEFEYAVNLLYLGVVSSLFAAFSNSANTVLFAQANHKYISVVTITSVVFNITLSIILGLKFGLIGLAAGGVVNSAIFNVFAKVFLFKQYNNYNMRGLYWCLSKSLLITIILGIAGSYLLNYLAINTWLEFLLSATLAFPFIVLICWVLLLDKDIKKTLLDYVIARIIPKVKKNFIKEL
ncbi:oligosaccharide flippase family protein [Colwellia sp. C1TZA3]|uniref:oligosaccharide flippase family protein n=1 Tax=Colwellia sp. C1TZA3 TaxID=2508879 RepID=UPI0011B96CDE|nr:oligosaccharide flippase family protein [Colwellia sp. C1TZA3]TWX67632.1 oligosaccharide flippase family protein [Colwellia sp. C1TZA3]